jgi:anti-anti-sigma factor
MVGLKIESEKINDKIVVRIEGRIDATSSPILEKKINKIIDENNLYLVLDFSEVEYLSSAGMRLLLSATKKLKAKSGSLVIFAIIEEVMEIIKMAGFEHILSICNSEEEALNF